MFQIPQTSRDIVFPESFTTTDEGLAGLGGNLNPGTLIDAYSKGLFPWFSDGEPILWWSPDPRMICLPQKPKVSKNMKKLLSKTPLKSNKKDAKTSGFPLWFCTINQVFPDVMQECSQIFRKNQTGTWITDSMRQAYEILHKIGYAHSFEIWNQDFELIGGLYGIAIGRFFFGESMFSKCSNASKTAFFHLCQFLNEHDFVAIDCQVANPHLEKLGGFDIPRSDFVQMLKDAQTPDQKISPAFTYR